MFTLTIQADTAAELHEKIMERAMLGGLSVISIYSPEQLLEELRKRLRDQNLVVKVEQFESDSVAACDPPPHEAVAAETDPPKKSRKRIEKAIEVLPEEVVTEAPKLELVPTRQDVTAALEAFAAKNGGQVAAREVMQAVGGSIKLADISEDKWPALIAALTAKEAC